MAMICRRNFIAGLMTLAMVPTIVRAQSQGDWFFGREFKNETIDLRGLKYVSYYNCKFECCRLLADAATDVNLMSCTFIDCWIEGGRVLDLAGKPDGSMNLFIRSDPFFISTTELLNSDKCMAVPVS